MEVYSLIQHPIAPSVILALIFAYAGHHFETKPFVILLGILSIFIIYYMSAVGGDKVIQSDITNLQEENESLKNNLMQVYSMVQQQKQSVPQGPPPPIPPSMTAQPIERMEEVEENEAKPYL